MIDNKRVRYLILYPFTQIEAPFHTNSWPKISMGYQVIQISSFSNLPRYYVNDGTSFYPKITIYIYILSLSIYIYIYIFNNHL